MANEGLTAGVVNIGEAHSVLTGRIGGVASHADVSLASAQLGNGAVEVHGDNFQLQLQEVSEVVAQGNVEAGQGGGAVFVQSVELVGGEVGGGDHGQLASGEGLQQRLQLLDGHGGIIGGVGFLLSAATSQQTQHHNNCQGQCNDLFHSVSPY